MALIINREIKPGLPFSARSSILDPRSSILDQPGRDDPGRAVNLAKLDPVGLAARSWLESFRSGWRRIKFSGFAYALVWPDLETLNAGHLARSLRSSEEVTSEL